MARYNIVKDGEWFFPGRKRYRLACCDCGLVHEVDFALVPWGRGKRIALRPRRHNRATAAKRRNRDAHPNK